MKDLNTLNKYRLKDKERELYGVKGDAQNGCFKVFVGGKAFYCIASNGGGWEHVSVSMKNHNYTPSWETMCKIKDMFFNDDEVVVEFHPKKDEYVNIFENCLHLWRFTNGSFPVPPIYYV